MSDILRIGIMLRHLNQHDGGVKNYTTYLLEELFTLNSSHEFVLIYNDQKNVGSFTGYSNVREIVVKIPSRFLWDQIGIPFIHKKERFDVVFNPKYSIPLLINCPTVFVCHGLDWYLMPWGSKWIDVLNHKYLFPSYVAKAKSIIAVSNTTQEHLINFFNVSERKINVAFLGVHDLYKQKMPIDKLEKIKLFYNLPDNFFLFVGQIYPPKNFGRLLRAYAKVGPKLGVHLVIAGEQRWLSREEKNIISQHEISDWIIKLGWVQHSVLPHIYSLAKALLLPSLYEACPSPILEAMATGCPIVTSNRFGTKEIAQDAALFVDPEDVNCIAEGMERIITDKEFTSELIQRGYKRVEEFNWKKCAIEILNVIEKAGSDAVSKVSTPQKVKIDTEYINKHKILNPYK